MLLIFEHYQILLDKSLQKQTFKEVCLQTVNCTSTLISLSGISGISIMQNLRISPE